MLVTCVRASFSGANREMTKDQTLILDVNLSFRKIITVPVIES